MGENVKNSRVGGVCRQRKKGSFQSGRLGNPLSFLTKDSGTVYSTAGGCMLGFRTSLHLGGEWTTSSGSGFGVLDG